MMNKKEQAALDSAQRAATINRALRWSAENYIKQDIPAPTQGETSGWIYNANTQRVTPAWSGVVAHGDGSQRGASASQGGMALYSTRKLALRAMRCELERQYATVLANVDAAIEGEP